MLDGDAARVASSFSKLDGLSLDDEASEPSQRSRAKTKDQAAARSIGRPSKASKPRRERVKFLRLTAEEEDVDLEASVFDEALPVEETDEARDDDSRHRGLLCARWKRGGGGGKACELPRALWTIK